MQAEHSLNEYKEESFHFESFSCLNSHKKELGTEEKLDRQRYIALKNP